MTPTVYEELDLIHGDVTLEVQTPGDPQTIHLKVPTRMLFITPGEGTEHRPI